MKNKEIKKEAFEKQFPSLVDLEHSNDIKGKKLFSEYQIKENCIDKKEFERLIDKEIKYWNSKAFDDIEITIVKLNLKRLEALKKEMKL